MILLSYLFSCVVQNTLFYPKYYLFVYIIYSKHVLSEDVVEREVKDGCLWSRRLITKTNKLPKWGERFVPGSKSACIVEESVVDPVKKTLTTYTRNINLTRIMVTLFY